MWGCVQLQEGEEPACGGLAGRATGERRASAARLGAPRCHLAGERLSPGAEAQHRARHSKKPTQTHASPLDESPGRLLVREADPKRPHTARSHCVTLSKREQGAAGRVRDQGTARGRSLRRRSVLRLDQSPRDKMTRNYTHSVVARQCWRGAVSHSKTPGDGPTPALASMTPATVDCRHLSCFN